jgi:hypothetical protein
VQLSVEMSPPSRCCVDRCVGAPTLTPVLRIRLVGSERVSRVVLPGHVCAAHRASFGDRFLTAARRTSIESALRARGRSAPDWARTAVEFE